ncbi:MAG: glycerophosphodiester phosphodiesterase [Verrucomicrobia bacterium]|nr:glycerophosphodiester phosphodiesterase [Verrucomicrobiota bacterium]
MSKHTPNGSATSPTEIAVSDGREAMAGAYFIVATMLFLTACSELEITVYPDAIPTDQILRPVMIVAHRGGMAYAPENTLTAIENGLRLEADILELDVQVRGNEIIVLHDFTLERTTNCSTKSSEADAAVREVCDAGYKWRPAADSFSVGFGPAYFRGVGITIPLLSDVLDSVSSSGIRLMIELKFESDGSSHSSLDDAVVTLINHLRTEFRDDRLWINSSNVNSLSGIEALWPEVSTIVTWFSTGSASCEEAVLDAISRGINGISIEASRSNPSHLAPCAQMARDSGLTVMFWVVNRASEVEELLPLEPDALITDYPACLSALLRDVRFDDPYADGVTLGPYFPKCG